MRGTWLLLTLVGCGGSSIEPKLSAIQAKVLTPNCSISGCHNAKDDQLSQLDLSAGNSFKDLVNVPAKNQGAVDKGLLLVKPGDPDNSFLLTKVAGPVPPTEGTQMPQSGPGLDADAISAIRTWIANGAQDN